MSYLRGISTLGCPDLDLPDLFRLAERFGLDAVELRSLGGTLDVPARLDRTLGPVEGAAGRLPPGRVRIVSLDTSLHLAWPKEDEKQAFLQFVPWAEALGVPWLRVFDGGKAPDDATHAAMAETVAWWRELRARHGWRCDLMIETHDALVSTASIQSFLRRAPGTAILWDTHHTWFRGGEDPVATWDAIRSSVVHLHVKDSILKPSGKHPFSYVFPGEGRFPSAPLFARLAKEFSGVVSLEWERLWHPDIPPVEDALAAAQARRWW